MQSARMLAVVLVAAFLGVADQSAPAPPRPEKPLPSWFLGAWKREWMRRHGATDDSVTVRYLQTPTMFGDVRIPANRPSPARAMSLADLTDGQLAALAKQQGFFGYTTIDGDIATWHHEIDYQPSEGVDTGRLERAGA